MERLIPRGAAAPCGLGLSSVHAATVPVRKMQSCLDFLGKKSEPYKEGEMEVSPMPDFASALGNH